MTTHELEQPLVSNPSQPFNGTYFMPQTEANQSMSPVEGISTSMSFPLSLRNLPKGPEDNNNPTLLSSQSDVDEGGRFLFQI